MGLADDLTRANDYVKEGFIANKHKLVNCQEESNYLVKKNRGLILCPNNRGIVWNARKL
jgi:hypothetical protein